MLWLIGPYDLLIIVTCLVVIGAVVIKAFLRMKRAAVSPMRFCRSGSLQTRFCVMRAEIHAERQVYNGRRVGGVPKGTRGQEVDLYPKDHPSHAVLGGRGGVSMISLSFSMIASAEPWRV